MQAQQQHLEESKGAAKSNEVIVKAGAVQEEIEVKQKCTDEDIKQLEVNKECEALANEFKSIYVAHSVSPVALTFTVQCIPGSRADYKAKKDLT